MTNEADVVDELFGGPRDTFLATRTEHAAQARAEGDRDLAERIAALRKPTVAAWLVNQFVRRCPDDVDTLVSVAAALGDAHRHGSGDEVRAAGGRRRELLRHLEIRVRDLAGRRLSDDVVAQVTTTFQAALIDPAALGAVCSGRLSTALELGQDTLDRWPAHEVTRPGRPAPTDRPAPPEPTTKPEPALIAARRQATRRARAAVAARARAEQDLTRAQQEVERTETRLAEARSAFDAAREAHDAAREAVTAARAAVSGAVGEQNAAERAAAAGPPT